LETNRIWLTPFRVEELSNTDKDNKSDKERKRETNLKEKDEKEEKQGAFWTLEKFATTTA
jgi:hypothetical protein